MNLKVRMHADEDAGRTGMVEVDVAEEQVAHVLERQAVVGQSLLERGNTRSGAAVEERGPIRGVEQVTRDDPLGTPVVKID
jgi:hypothetical protein